MPTALVLPQVNLHLLGGMLPRLHGAAINNGAALTGLHIGKPTWAAQPTPNRKAKVRTKEMIKVKPKRKTKLKTGRRKETSGIVFNQIQPNVIRGIPMVAGRSLGP